MSESIRLSHRAVATSALAVVLAGGAFAPALADGDGKGGRGDKGRSEQARERREGRGSAARAEKRARPQGSRGESRPQQAPGSAQDPAGNNGTFKVDGLPYDGGMDNEPHVSCAFRLLFFGFDEGQTGDITIAGQAPSGSGVVSTRSGVLLSDDPAGGGPNDPDAVVTYSLSDLDLTGLTAHDKHGYHLKVTVATGEPGGVKHKVFWLEPCGAEAGAAAGAASAAGAENVEAGASGSVGAVGAVEQGSESRTAVLGTRLTREQQAAAGRRGAEVLGVSAARRSLAFTGSLTERLLALAAGLLATGLGILVLASSRPKGRHAL